MAVDVDVTISVEDSPIANALDLYYDNLHALLNPQTSQKVALNSTLVTFDILPKAPMYTEYVFRAFADRTLTISPTEFGPVALGVANTKDRYSWFFTEMLRQAIFQLDLSMPQEVIDKIDLVQREISVTRKELQDFTNSIFSQWNAHALANHIKGDDPYFLDKQTAFFNINNFAEQISYFKSSIAENLQRIYLLRDARYPDAEAKHIASLLKHATLDQYLMPRPKDPILEEINSYDPIKLGQAHIYNNLNYFETSVEVRPSGFLPKFLTNVGKRDISIKKGATATHQHDFSWSASGSARKWFFFKASVNASYEHHLKESVTATNEINIGFENLAEYWVNRGPWFASNVFDYKRVRDVLAKNPKMAGLLGYTISSVILGRGMSLTLQFSKQSDFSEWSKFTSSASGSFSVFGMNVPLTNGSLSTYDLRTKTASDNKSVTFFDSPDHARLLGFRVDQLFDGAKEFAMAASPYLDEISEDPGAAVAWGELGGQPAFRADRWRDDLIETARKKILA